MIINERVSVSSQIMSVFFFCLFVFFTVDQLYKTEISVVDHLFVYQSIN